MPGSKELTSELVALIKQQASTNDDSTEPGHDRSSKPSTEFLQSPEAISRCTTSQNFMQSQPSLTSPLRLAPCSAIQAASSFTASLSGANGMRHPHSDPTSALDDLNGNSFNSYPAFYSIIKPGDPDLTPDPILHWYGQNRSSRQDKLRHTIQHDIALLEQYIQSNSKLTAQLAFMRNQRKKKQTDGNLVEDYRFIVSLYTMLMTMEFKSPPRQHLSSKAILTCLGVTASWLSRAKQVVKLLNKIGPDGSSPDPLVTNRLQSKVVIHKGSDLLTFLRQRVRAP